MRAIFIYNPHNNKELDLIDRAKQELGQYIEELSVIDIDKAKEFIKISSTPALIPIRDDLQGSNLLEEDIDRSKLRVTLELLKVMEQEDNNIFNRETNRIDYIVDIEKTKAIDNYTLELIDGGVI